MSGYYEDGAVNAGVESADFRICMGCWVTSHIDDMDSYGSARYTKLACSRCGCKDVAFALVIDGVLTVDDGVPV